MNRPLISIIIPTYNRSSFISRAINSALHQTYRNTEIIIIDDSSTDNTRYLTNSIRDPRIRYFRHTVRKGAAAARNTGIKKANGDYIAFLDSDDEWMTDKLEKQMTMMQSLPGGYDVIYSGFIKYSSGKCTYFPETWVKKKEDDISSQLSFGNFIGTPTILCRKKIDGKIVTFDEKLPRFQDWELMIRLAQITQFKIIDEPLVVAYYSDENISSNATYALTAMEIITKNHRHYFENNPKHFSKNLMYMAYLAFSLKLVKKGRHYVRASIKYYPYKISPLLAYIVSLFGSKAYISTHRTTERLINLLSLLRQ